MLYLVAVRAVGETRRRDEREHDANMARMWKVAQHEGVGLIKVDHSAGAAVICCHGLMVLHGAAEYSVCAEIVSSSFQALAADNGETVIKAVEHQPLPLFLRQEIFVACSDVHWESIYINLGTPVESLRV